MPYKSQAQAAWAHTPEGMRALGGAEAVAHWDAETRGKKLPERAKAKDRLVKALEKRE